MEYRLSDSELEIMNILWKRGVTSAVDITSLLKDSIGWDKSTTYTLITRLIKKGAVEKQEPGYLCRPVARQEEVREVAANSLLNKLYDGSLNLLVQSFVKDKKLSREEIAELKQMLDEMED